VPNQRIVNSAKIIQAQALKEKGSSVYLAIGSGSASWDTEIQVNKTFVSDQFTLLPTNAYADQVKLYLLNTLATQYVSGIDFLFDTETGICTRVVGGAIAANATVTVVYKAIGLVTAVQTALVNEVGRRRASLSYAVIDNVNGSYLINGTKYSISGTPTEFLIATVTFPEGELTGTPIRESGLFFSVVPDLTSYTVTRTFSTSKIVIDTDIQNGYKTANNVVVKSQNLVTTYVAGTDYILDAETSEVWRLPTGAITGGQIVSVTYEKIASELLLPADITNIGTLYLAKTAPTINKLAEAFYTDTFLIQLTR
jgi:hypothetical protein